MSQNTKLCRALQKVVNRTIYPNRIPLDEGCEVKAKEKLRTCIHYFEAKIVKTWTGIDDVLGVGGAIAEKSNRAGAFVINRDMIIENYGMPLTLRNLFYCIKSIHLDYYHSEFFTWFKENFDCSKEIIEQDKKVLRSFYFLIANVKYKEL